MYTTGLSFLFIYVYWSMTPLSSRYKNCNITSFAVCGHVYFSLVIPFVFIPQQAFILSVNKCMSPVLYLRKYVIQELVNMDSAGSNDGLHFHRSIGKLFTNCDRSSAKRSVVRCVLTNNLGLASNRNSLFYVPTFFAH